MRLKIEKLIYGGDGLARLPGDERGAGKSVFVPFVLTNEEVAAAIVEEKRGFARAHLQSVIESAPHRIQPTCPYFQGCGGCHYQHADYENQLAIKAEILRETLRRTAKLELPCELKVHASPPWNYRNRTRMKVQTTPEFALGYYRFRSHQLLAVEQCPISSPLINQAIAALWEKGRTKGFPEPLREIEFFANEADTSLLLELYLAHGISTQEALHACEAIAGFLPQICGVVAFEQMREGQFADPKKLAEAKDTNLQYAVGSNRYRVSAGVFFQVNRFLLNDLVEIVTGGVSGRVAFDLYAGVGLFSSVLAKSFAQMIAVEASQTAHADLRHNVPPEVKAVRATTEQFLADSKLRADFVIADPPRGGLGESVVRSIGELRAPRMTYVSCDPSTVARDLHGLVSLGYRIERAHLLDLFPQTFHIESVFHLVR